MEYQQYFSKHAGNIYLDFSKAFDKVEIGVLLHKLRDSKVLGKIGVWLGHFLDSQQRQQAVAVEGRLSGLSPVISGVPQGTVLGPILFLLHISCLAREVSPGSTVSSYVDDTRVSRGITNSTSDCLKLQQDLEAIYRWAEDTNMIFNADKFEMLRFWPGTAVKPTNIYKDPDGGLIEEKPHLKDLGVEISSDLTFSIHIENVVAASTRMVGWVLRTFRRRSRVLMLTVWKSLIQSKLDYCSQLWSPCDQTSIAKLEGVARSFSARVAGMDGLDYWDRLQKLGCTPRKEGGRGTRSSLSGNSPRALSVATPCHFSNMQEGEGLFLSHQWQLKHLQLSGKQGRHLCR